MDITLSLMGFLLGLCVGLTSMGGGALMAPFLILVVGARPAVAVGTDLAYGAITKIFGACVHWRQQTVDIQVVKTLAFGSLPGGVLGALCLPLLGMTGYDMDFVIKRAIGIVLVLVGVALFVRFAADRIGTVQASFPRLQGTGTIVFAAMVGFAVGLTSIGSGSLLTPFLLMVYPLSASQVVGTDLFHAAILVTVTALVHVGGGTVDWALMPPLLLGSIPGVLLGSWLAPRVPAPVLRFSLASVLLASGLKLI